jgi:hypothetical protein
VLAELRNRLELWRKDTMDFIRSPRPRDTFDRATGKRLAVPGGKKGGKK